MTYSTALYRYLCCPFRAPVSNTGNNAFSLSHKLFEEKVAAKKAVGEVLRKNFFVAANNAKSPIVSNDNFLKSDIDKITAKAKEYGVPVSVVGNGEKQSISYLERDKDVVNQIMDELVSERLTENAQSVKSFTISEGGISAMKAEFDKNGLDCAFVQSADGKYHCIYPAEDAARGAVVKPPNVCSAVFRSFVVQHTVYNTQNEQYICVVQLFQSVQSLLSDYRCKTAYYFIYPLNSARSKKSVVRKKHLDIFCEMWYNR